ncbi:two-component sensor histidine kinase [Bacillus sp. ISL-40]|uniref:ATP-binding protein n=1 Tax=unclassified Bacillus (in: firmicutes) TaxID=185979 RepID=UPI001BE946AA|nr:MULTISPECIES: ATP-binding protein [unclassified Bacillus (in: firmicutes)]MBT2697320.1 two-component sensor histidine kinase [Bacillus sp. ISL-40]MBT2723819.1 two-component sensor histidine kinase [Bacillus sp. ISL-46]MBT2741863.1 two-component sensor histidine kinase [Bacillus sp. ISL-77]
MKEGVNNPKLLFEERKAITLFLWLFYFMFYSFDIFYNYIRPYLNDQESQFDTERVGLGIWLYILILALLPIAIYFIKKGNPYIVKYIYIISYIGIDILDTLLEILGTTASYAAGNIVEVLFVLFSPIFVNKKYFWVVSLGMIGKELLLGIILQDLNVLIPTVIYVILSVIAYILVIRFNSYIQTLTTVYEELRQKEKLAVIGQMAAAIGHEIRNPLSSLKGFTQVQQERYPNTNDYYPIMIQEIDRINSIVNDLMYIGKPRVIKFEKASIEEIIAYTLSITQQQAERQGVIVETIMAGPLPPLDCDDKQLKQVFINLIKNAIEAMPEGGRIEIRVKVLEKHKLSVSIQDEGCGIADENILNLGEPFFTTKTDGTGLGLMVTNQLIKDHRGAMKIKSIIDKGTRVIVTLPILQIDK